MLRNFQYKSHQPEILNVLKRFGFDFKDEKYPVNLLRFEVITPDSFMWRISAKGAIYYIYAEDYVSSLEYIKDVFKKYLKSDEWELVKSPDMMFFKDSSPVHAAATYTEPDNSQDLMVYAIDSGNDFVFLAKSNEDDSNANFSDYAPNGFNQHSVN